MFCNTCKMTARTKLFIPTTVVALLTFAIAAATASIAADTFPIHSAYAQSIQPPPGASTPTYTPPSGNTTIGNSTSGNATK
jgi:hypothetical protein